MPIYVGDSSDKAKSVKSIYVGDENNIARRVKYVYVGDENNKAKLVYNYDDRNYESPIWTSASGVGYNKTNFPLPSVSNSNGYIDTFTSDFVLREGDTYKLTAVHSVTIAEGESDSINVSIGVLADENGINGLDLSFVGDTSGSKSGAISGTIGADLVGKVLRVRILMEGAGSKNTSQKIEDISLTVNGKTLIE